MHPVPRRRLRVHVAANREMRPAFAYTLARPLIYSSRRFSFSPVSRPFPSPSSPLLFRYGVRDTRKTRITERQQRSREISHRNRINRCRGIIPLSTKGRVEEARSGVPLIRHRYSWSIDSRFGARVSFSTFPSKRSPTGSIVRERETSMPVKHFSCPTWTANCTVRRYYASPTAPHHLYPYRIIPRFDGTPRENIVRESFTPLKPCFLLEARGTVTDFCHDGYKAGGGERTRRVLAG